jgi:UDP-3-O-[3-hydroxymyristoyl] glucosamine N-acyltransferase
VGPGAVIGAGAKVGPQAQIGPQAFVGHSAQVGARTVLHPGAKVLWGCTVGDDCVLHPGCVIGGDGFGLAQGPHGPEHLKVPQMGTVAVGHKVEIGANSTIDRATFGVTCIGDGCKIDNLVQIGHNVTLGKHCVVVSQSGIAGSATLGDSITVGAQAGIVGHLHIAAGTTLAARTGVISSLTEPGVYAGAPAMEHRAWLRMMAALRDLAPMRKRLAALYRQQPPNEVL